MARIAVEVDANELQRVIAELESSNTYSSHNELWLAVSNTEWARAFKPRPLSPSLIMLHAKRNNLVFKTPKGVRGRTKGEGWRKRRIDPDSIAAMRKSKPEFENFITRIEKGSAKAAIALNCLECSGFSRKEVACCQIKSCALWNFRPYKGGIVEPDDTPVDSDKDAIFESNATNAQ